MNSISKNIIFYVTIVENNEKDHSFLRTMIHSVLPQAIIDSVYSDEETIRYFNNCASVPHLIFLDKDMLNVSGRDTIQLIKHVDGLNQVPIVFLSTVEEELKNTPFIKQKTDHVYSKPFGARDLLNIVRSVNSKWLA